ncbi:PLC-like phosphodiesterase [Flagelloscypha sp. PMI_526]|nr:PLC-like phosphodiesterase [Flagelloscypha sp. PMI_526]
MFSRLALLSLLYLVSSSVRAEPPSQSVLAKSALQEILRRGQPILGDDNGCNPHSPTCNWMAKIPDHTPLTAMNIPGTHDAATWNYSQATQDSLMRYTGSDIPPASFYRCQEKSFFDQLNDGIRAFDLRVAYNPGDDTLGFWHSVALLAPTTTLDDVLFGFYNWLNEHPTETLLISINREGGHIQDQKLEELLVRSLTNDLAKKYWVSLNGKLGTLGQSRGKLNLLQRFDLHSVNQDALGYGIHLSGSKWSDNGADIKLVYNDNPERAAYIEDTYEPIVPSNSGAAANIASKVNVTTAHLAKAAVNSTENLFISFASAEKTADDEPVTPIIMALGPSGNDGVNQALLPYLESTKGKRRGVVMLDFYNNPPNLVQAVIGL